MVRRLPLAFVFVFTAILTGSAQKNPVRLGIAGLSHGHVGWILSRKDSGDVKVVGIVETNQTLAKRLSAKYGFSLSLVYPTLEAMIAAAKPEAVCAFGNTYDHLAVVEACAPRRIPVMVEKPLAVNLEHARKIEALALRYKTTVLTDYETSWYPTNVKARELLAQGTIGRLRKVVVRDGHAGFAKQPMGDEFVQWLTDPKLNGAGAIMDFGCYGANIMTWLLQGKRPLSVTTVSQQLQPNVNPKVEDDATIILKYDSSIALLQPSWDWPIGRKDMELYGTTGVIYSDNRNQLRVRIAEGYDGFREDSLRLPERPSPFNDPFAVFAAVVRGELTLEKFDPYSLGNNMIVMEILDAAVRGAKEERTVRLAGMMR